MAGISKLAMELSYAVVETPIGSFTLGASESAIHEAFFGKPSVGVSLASHVEHPILSMVHFPSPLLSFMELKSRSVISFSRSLV